MQQAQSIVILLALVALAAAPGVWVWARRRDAEPQPASPAPVDPTAVPGVLHPHDALAHQLYGQAVGWADDAMVDYDASPALQAMWRAEARYALARGK